MQSLFACLFLTVIHLSAGIDAAFISSPCRVHQLSLPLSARQLQLRQLHHDPLSPPLSLLAATSTKEQVYIDEEKFLERNARRLQTSIAQRLGVKPESVAINGLNNIATQDKVTVDFDVVGVSDAELKRLANQIAQERQRTIRIPSQMSGESKVLAAVASDKAATTKGKGKEKAPFDATMSKTTLTTLKEEASYPFRNLRYAIYIVGIIGGVLAGAANTLGLLGGEMDINTALQNYAVDGGVLVGAALLFRFERQRQLDATARLELLETRKEGAIAPEELARRAKVIASLPLAVSVGTKASGAEAFKETTVGEIQDDAGQHVVIVGAPTAKVTDALVSAQIKGSLFRNKDVLIVPVEMRRGKGGKEGGKGGGFGEKRPSWRKQGYIAEPVDEESWRAALRKEIQDAERQGAGKAKEEGIVLVVRNDGKVVARRVGTPDWTLVLEAVEPDITRGAKSGEEAPFQTTFQQ
ncbi:unnamed protein product [Vitrella brassicaformis CCMP3155]|uniref:HMA domain-containing protein n=1 Tax=Vitrella brassicaformis (strain CCMP3155) TaxID=1169540 RepID=A0A0G4FNK1_VITBC|nr:unnamed protein product [Vitrella brassicaformis CCMP3155]|eukprot:CEM15622.1 unnamed protein product [Vitrella brassicaformis CCMP3155]